MDAAECDCGDGISAEVSSLYETSYLKSFLPVYHVVNQSANISSISDRFKAIKFAADAALALTASGTCWSEALSKKLEDACGEQGMSDHLFVDRLCISPESSTSSGATTAEQDLPGIARTGSVDEASTPGRRSGLWSASLNRRVFGARNNLALRSLFTGRSSNWSRSHLCSREASRLAVSRKLSLRSKSKRRSLRSCWKPRTPLRKAKSLAKIRSRALCCTRPVTALDTRVEERRFGSSINALQQLIPGGVNMDASVLLDETADFVMFLKMQVQALQTVCNAVEMRDRLDEIIPEL